MGTPESCIFFTRVVYVNVKSVSFCWMRETVCAVAEIQCDT